LYRKATGFGFSAHDRVVFGVGDAVDKNLMQPRIQRGAADPGGWLQAMAMTAMRLELQIISLAACL
jgi:hypothetical protein